MALASSNTTSTISRYRPAILVLTVLGAAASVYYIHGSYFSHDERPLEHSLRRRNALHRPNGRRRSGEQQRQAGDTVEGALDTIPHSRTARFEARTRFLEACGTRTVETSRGGRLTIFLTPAVLQNTDEFRRAHGLSEAEATQARHELEGAFLDSFLQSDIPLEQITEASNHRGEMWDEFIGLGFLEDNLVAAMARYNTRLPARTHHRSISEAWDRAPGQQGTDADIEEERTSNDLDGRETVVDANSEFSWHGEHSNDAPKEGQSLLNLLYHIAEDQARREGYVHRGVTCNSCGSMPIRGIRYRCANCVDYDLCETCEAMQVHPRTHLFYKVRIPAPFLGNPRQAQPVWYPGKPSSLPQNISRELAKKLVKETGFENPEIEALWDQFRCLAATEWVEDPIKLNMAIDRRTFDRCFVPNTSVRPPPPNLIYDRMFAFYDTNGDGLIGFEEFLKGLASLNNKSKDERMKRVFQGYDIDGDGYVDRKDFLRMFRAFYALSKELTRDMVAGMEEDVTEGNAAKEIVLSSQPISSAFTGSIPPGERSRTGEGKRRDVNGDDEIIDNKSPLRESASDTGNANDVAADAAERAAFGNIASESDRKPWESMFIDGETGRAFERVENELSQAFLRGQHRSTSEDWDTTGEEDEDGNPGAEDSDSHEPPKDDAWPPHYIRSADVESVLGSDVSIHDVSDPQARKMVQAAARQRIDDEDRSKRDEVRQKAMQDRWRRRKFYLDEEDGGVAPEGFKEIRDEDEAENEDVASDERSGASEFHSPSPRSRSSSKVRFQDDVTDVDDTRSNASISSRNIPVGERWGGYEIPEAEKDVGKEVLYQVTQQGLNEMLDPLFQKKEDLAMEALATRAERKKWGKEISQLMESKRKETATQKSQRPPPKISAPDTASLVPWYDSPGELSGTADLHNEVQSTAPAVEDMDVASFAQDALRYIKQVELQFKDQPNAYKHFLEILKAFKAQILNPSEVMLRASALFAGHPELIYGLNVFLLPGYQIEPGPEEYPTTMRIITPTGSTPIFIHKDVPLSEVSGNATATNETEPPSSPPALFTQVVEELHKGSIAFDGGDAALEPAILARPLDELLKESGYSIAAPSSDNDSLLPISSSLEVQSQPLPLQLIPVSHESSRNRIAENGVEKNPVSESTDYQQTHSTQLDNISNTRFPVVGQTILYNQEHISGLDAQQREALSAQLNARYRALHPTVASYASSQQEAIPNVSSPATNGPQSPTADATPTSTCPSEETSAAYKELKEIRRQIVLLLDLDIAADRAEMARRKMATNGSSSNPSLPQTSIEDTHPPNTQSNPSTPNSHPPDPTLPQNRPNSILPPPSLSPLRSSQPPPSPPQPAITTPPAPPSQSHLDHLSTLDAVERENDARGGPGRLNFEEFEEIMKGERGRKLGFVGAWIEMASF
ncbi:MAG: hypothetical protein M1830_010786 [Pleopsidium flavum]|nr:MAG: hypothetical protein M1830_010786 [Pleopsidium flavum]